jgi:hypothetical protein
MAKRERKLSASTVRDMARRRGLAIHRAVAGGWYVVLIGYVSGQPAPTPVLYATHDWNKAKAFVKKQPTIIKVRPEFSNSVDRESDEDDKS